jgi:hypothetical protein
MNDYIRKKKEKGIRKLEKYLEDKGYYIVEHDKTRKHDTITVKRLDDKNNPEADSVTTTVSHRITMRGDSQSRLKMILKEIENLFSGRKRRGQGQFKLSTQPTVKNQWFDVLKKVDD